MINVLIRHKVESYDAWKPLFDEHAETRRQGGSRGGVVMRGLEDPNDLTILLQWDDVDSAREFVQNPNLHEVMKQGGVLGKPDVVFLDEGTRTRI